MKSITKIEQANVDEYEAQIKQHGTGTLNPTQLGIEYHDGKMHVVMDCEPDEAGMLLANLIANLIVKHGKEYHKYATEVVTNTANVIVRARMPKELRSLVDDIENDDNE